jgi:hypothetical protein
MCSRTNNWNQRNGRNGIQRATNCKCNNRKIILSKKNIYVNRKQWNQKVPGFFYIFGIYIQT